MIPRNYIKKIYGCYLDHDLNNKQLLFACHLDQDPNENCLSFRP